MPLLMIWGESERSDGSRAPRSMGDMRGGSELFVRRALTVIGSLNPLLGWRSAFVADFTYETLCQAAVRAVA